MKALNYFLCMLQISTIFAVTISDINSLLTPPEAVKFQGATPNSLFGVRVQDAGDFNNDGYNDIVIGSPNSNGGSGVAFLVYGKPSLDLSDIDFSTPLDPSKTGFTITGRTTVGNFGWSVAGVGDVNGDKIDDIIIGAPLEYVGMGAAFIIYGEKTPADMNLGSQPLNPSTTGFEIKGSYPMGSLGRAVSGAGDFNGDGNGDILIGAPGEGLSYQGTVYVLYNLQALSTAIIDLSLALSSSIGFKIIGNPNDILGNTASSVSSAGDVNNDGLDDIIFGTFSQNGGAYVIYGKKNNFVDIILSSALDPSSGFSITGPAQSGFGFSVNRAGRVNNDKYGDIIIGAPYKDFGKGVAYVIYGRAGMTSLDLSSVVLDPATTGFMVSGEQTGDSFGMIISKASDINNDGFDDLFVSASMKNVNEGAVYVIYGGLDSSNIDISTLNPLTNGFKITGIPGSSFGFSIDIGVDVVNGVKRRKLLVGAYAAFNGKGGAFVILPWSKKLNWGFVEVTSSLEICSTNCDACNYPTSCSACSVGYGLENSQCIVCPTIGKYLPSNGFCSDCPKGTYFSNGNCKSCPPGCSECTSNSACQDCHEGYTLSSDSQLCKQNEIENDREKGASGAFEGTSIAGAALGSGSSLPINFGLVAKILRNVKYLNITVSEELEETFHSWKVNGGFLKAPNSWSQESSSKPLPGVFSRYSLDPVFLINYWKPFIMTLIGFALFGIFKIVEILIMNDGDGGKQNSLIPRKINIAASNFALTQIYSNLDDVIFYFILDVRSTELDGAFRGFSLVLAVIMLLIAGIILRYHGVFLRKYKNLKGGGEVPTPGEFQRFLYKFENMKLIFEDFKDTSVIEQSFLLIQLVRSLVCSLVFVLLFEYPLVQTLLLLMLNIGMIVFLIMKRPFKDFLGICSQLFCEIILLLANICMLVMAVYDETKSHSIEAITNLSRAVVVLNIILLIGCAILMVIGILKGFYTSYQAKKNNNNNQVLKLKTVTRLPQKNNKLDDDRGANENQLQNSNYQNSTQQEYPQQNSLYSVTTGRGGGYNKSLNEIQRRVPYGNNHFERYTKNKNYELGSNTSFPHQNDHSILNTSSANLLHDNSQEKREYLSKVRLRGKIKMPGGVEFQPRLNYETPIKEMSTLSSKSTNMKNVNPLGFESEFESPIRMRNTRKNHF